jgi:oxygen-independent coproporphyrinogen III oxidase
VSTRALLPVEHLYLHVPFCARRCSYCDFSIAVRRVVPWQEYVDAVERECRWRGLTPDAPPLKTVYLGGGTPSRLGGDGVVALFEALRRYVTWHHDAEVTLEANPEDVTADAVRRWRAAGVNRISLGTQSFDDRVLQWMHRVHDAAMAKRAVDVVRQEGISSLSLDLIFAAPESLDRNWALDVEMALQLEPDHLSVYGLTVEPQTPLGRWASRGEIAEAPEERFEAEFLLAHDQLDRAGFEHYEVSNYARPGRRARHNSAYWHGVPYWGLGPAAHGFDGETRCWNRAAYTGWTAALAAGLDPSEGQERLTPDDRVAEAVYLGLRTTDGLPISEGEQRMVAPWVAAGWATVSETARGGVLTCTPLGWLRLDRLAADLTAFRSGS